jgi:hypothetical protein
VGRAAFERGELEALHVELEQRRGAEVSRPDEGMQRPTSTGTVPASRVGKNRGLLSSIGRVVADAATELVRHFRQ